MNLHFDDNRRSSSLFSAELLIRWRWLLLVGRRLDYEGIRYILLRGVHAGSLLLLPFGLYVANRRGGRTSA